MLNKALSLYHNNKANNNPLKKIKNMKAIIEIKSILGKVLFELECENNTIRNTIECANLEGANLECANLEGANLECANLKGANLEGANLKGANLKGANLECANLEGATLECATLECANLEGVNLEDVNMPIYCKWNHSVINNNIKIGCQTKSIEEWDLFFNSEEEFTTPRNTPDFNKIQAVFEAYKAYINFLNK